MVRPRKQLSEMLKEVLPGIKHFYFNPPSKTQLKYPCCVYKEVSDDSRFADNKPYVRHKRYTVTIIDKDPDSLYSDILLESIPYCSLDRVFTMDNLKQFTHTVFF